MAMDLSTLRKLVSLDENDPLSRFALGKKLFELHADDPAALQEAADHLRFANEKAPDHLATYHILGQTLARLGETAEARRVYEAGLARVAAVGEGMGRDLGPAMQQLLDELR
jgi:Flp pilus assembly protein TadD